MTNFINPHRNNPTSLVNHEPYAPGLAIYIDNETQDVTVTSTDVLITVGTDLVTISYSGKSLEELANEISSSSRAIVASPLGTRRELSAGSLFLGASTTPEGGFIVRVESHTIRYTAETRIRALMPYGESRSLPWYPRVDRGNVTITQNGVTYIFSVPEYDNQVWSEYFDAPYVDVIGERVQLVDTKTLKLNRTPVLWEGRNVFISVDGNLVGSSLISDIDVHNGLVYLSSDILGGTKITVSYTYQERSYVYRRVNLNPAVEHNPNIVDRAVVLYLLPTQSSLGRTRTSTVRHALGQTIKGALESISPGEEPILVIGAYHVKPMGSVVDIQKRDSRSRGGGINPDGYDEALRRNHEVYSVADAGRWDGVPFPAAASGVVILPRSLLTRFSEDLIRSAVGRHLATGGNIVLDFSDDLNTE